MSPVILQCSICCLPSYFVKTMYFGHRNQSELCFKWTELRNYYRLMYFRCLTLPSVPNTFWGTSPNRQFLWFGLVGITTCIQFEYFFTSPTEYLLDRCLGLVAQGTDCTIWLSTGYGLTWLLANYPMASNYLWVSRYLQACMLHCPLPPPPLSVSNFICLYC